MIHSGIEQELEHVVIDCINHKIAVIRWEIQQTKIVIVLLRKSY